MHLLFGCYIWAANYDYPPKRFITRHLMCIWPIFPHLQINSKAIRKILLMPPEQVSISTSSYVSIQMHYVVFIRTRECLYIATGQHLPLVCVHSLKQWNTCTRFHCMQTSMPILSMYYIIWVLYDLNLLYGNLTAICHCFLTLVIVMIGSVKTILVYFIWSYSATSEDHRNLNKHVFKRVRINGH